MSKKRRKLLRSAWSAGTPSNSMIVHAAKAIIIDHDGRGLVVWRSKTHPHAPITPDLPGGKVEEGETMVQGLIREVEEETGIRISESTPKLIGSATGSNYFGKDFYVELFEAKLANRPNITLSYEHERYEWVPLGQMKVVGRLFGPLVDKYKSAL